jgi:hypothetical protein
VSAAVRNSKGRVVKDLKPATSSSTTRGAREIKDVYFGDSPISLAILLDISGSMAVGGNIDRAREAIGMVAANLRDSRTRRRSSRSIRSFRKSSASPPICSACASGRSRGSRGASRRSSTPSRDGAARGRARQQAPRAARGYRRGGYGSKLTPAQVSGVAELIDVPVYLLAVVNPADHPEGEFQARPTDAKTSQQGELADLARWTGGDLRYASLPSHLVEAVRDILTELRFQYLITSSRAPALDGTRSKSGLGNGT